MIFCRKMEFIITRWHSGTEINLTKYWITVIEIYRNSNLKVTFVSHLFVVLLIYMVVLNQYFTCFGRQSTSQIERQDSLFRFVLRLLLDCVCVCVCVDRTRSTMVRTPHLQPAGSLHSPSSWLSTWPASTPHSASSTGWRLISQGKPYKHSFLD